MSRLWNCPWADMEFRSHEAWEANRHTVLKQSCCVWWECCALNNSTLLRGYSSNEIQVIPTVLFPEVALHFPEHTFFCNAPQFVSLGGSSFFRRAIFFSNSSSWRQTILSQFAESCSIDWWWLWIEDTVGTYTCFQGKDVKGISLK